MRVRCPPCFLYEHAHDTERVLGIWTKHLKAKTSLHQTVIDRCLKTLTQKHLIKRVPSVQVRPLPSQAGPR